MKLYVCNFKNCEKSFRKPSYLQEHLNTHLKIRPFVCNFCKLSYFKKRHLDRHLLTHKKKEFVCEKCKLSFTENYRLANHLLICKKSYNCNCGKVYVRKKLFDKHCLNCEGSKSIKHIKKENNKKKTLRIDRDIQTLQKRSINILDDEYDCKYQCKHCDKQYASKSNLYVHFRTTHLNIRKYECKCGKSYLHNVNLRKHTKICSEHKTSV